MSAERAVKMQMVQVPPAAWLSVIDYDLCPLVKAEVAGEDCIIASILWCGSREGEDSQPYVFHRNNAWGWMMLLLLLNKSSLFNNYAWPVYVGLDVVICLWLYLYLFTFSFCGAYLLTLVAFSFNIIPRIKLENNVKAVDCQGRQLPLLLLS